MWGQLRMKRVAVFVDAGYLFAAGSALLTGSKKDRRTLSLKKTATIDCLQTFAEEKASDSELLRIYWYDGASGNKGPTGEQSDLAYRDNIKVRLGFINSHGQQKGVDSLIVTDLIELARNKSITDAVLLAGDEDLRVGVQMAQNFGVRVHLIGIQPCRGNQSNQLLQEVDTCSEWTKAQLQKLIEYQEPVEKKIIAQAIPKQKTLDETGTIDRIIDAYAKELGTEKIAEIKIYIENKNGIPPEHDGSLLRTCRGALGRDLDIDERRELRFAFRKKVLALKPAAN